MVKQKQFYVLKFKSSRLKDFKYNIKYIDCDLARKYKELISIGDSQMLQVLRRLTKKDYNFNKVDSLIKLKNELKLQSQSVENKKQLKKIQMEIDKTMFIPEYISVVIEKYQHYDRLFNLGFKVNNIKYKRISCSASQARVNTVIFVPEIYEKELKRILDNDRINKDIVPNKYNAYFGLNSSSIYTVTTPRFCVVPDKEIEMTKMVDFIDDNEKINPINKKLSFNLFDGQGLISPNMAKVWAKDMGIIDRNTKEIEYTPSYFIGRSVWIKGAFFTFDFHKFAKEIAKTKYIKDIYGNQINIEDYDVVVSQSQFKLWNNYDSFDEYKENIEKNKLVWGVTRVAPKPCKIDDYIFTNYQFLQTLNLSDTDIEALVQPTIDWINNVIHNNPLYTILFLAGKFSNDDNISYLLEHTDNPYIKAIMYNHKMINDTYIHKKIYDTIKKKIQEAKLGKILIDGNFQMMCADTYAMCEHIFGMNVEGLLKENEYYSNYWNNKNVIEVDAMRSPLTFFSEHNILSLKNNSDMQNWYEYQYGTIIYNVWGTDCIKHADSDFDGDIVCTTNNKYFLKGVYKEYLPITYDKNTATKVQINDKILMEADKKAFFSKIGSITNVSTSFYALLPLFKKGSKEYNEIIKRLKLLRKEQGNQIDAAKGIQVKPFDKTWIHRSKTEKNDTEEIKKEKEFNNTILADKKPYFMIYLYNYCKKDYIKHINKCNTYSQIQFGCDINTLLKKENRNKLEEDEVKYYYKNMPVIISDCTMNRICRYVENIDNFEFKNVDIAQSNEAIYLMKDRDIPFNKNIFNQVRKIFKEYKTYKYNDLKNNDYNNFTINNSNIDYDGYNSISEYFRNKLLKICSDVRELANYAVDLCYIENDENNKDFVWKLCIDGVLENIKKNSDYKVIIPVEDKEGNINYLNNKYSAKVVYLNE